MLDGWLEADCAYTGFWDRTPREITRILTAKSGVRVQNYDMMRMVAHEAAALMAFAWHNPRKTPKFRPAQKSKAEKPIENPQAVRDWFIRRSRQNHA